MAHLDRAHLDAVDHFGDAAELACRIDRNGHFVVGRVRDSLCGLGGVDRLDVAFRADMRIAQLGRRCGACGEAERDAAPRERVKS